MQGVPWETYKALDLDLEGHGVRLTYLNGTLEIMPPPISDGHEARSYHFGHFIGEYCVHHEIDFWGRGSKTLQILKTAGAEPDEQFYFNEKGEYPDLVIEIALTSGGIPKLEVYHPFQIPEIWIWRENKLEVYVFDPAGYQLADASDVLSGIDLKTLARCARIEKSSEAIRQYRASLSD